MKGKLYLVATPIGNLEDITLRAINCLKNVDIIACEDTRHTLKLLNHLEIKKKLISYHRHNEDIKSALLINLLINGKDIALVSDAGTPAICDPGEEIVKEAIKNNIEIIPIPGACALINALIVSGMNTKEFAFYGFLPLNKKNRQEKLKKIKDENKTTILYEAPHKLINTLKDIQMVCGDSTNIVLAKELTKIHENIIRGNINEIIKNLEDVKGEFIIIIEENISNNNIINTEIDLTLDQLYKKFELDGLNKKEIIKRIAKVKKVSKNEIYQYFLNK